MLKRTALFRLLLLATMLVATHVVGWASDEAKAQQAQQGSGIQPGPFGGYSTTLSDIWGPPKMPATPKDFGPHFDFPAGGDQTLTCGAEGSQYFCGGPSDSPYPN